MANIYCAIVEDANNNVHWNGTTAWGYDATSDIHNPTPHVDEAARDAQYTAVYPTLFAWEEARDAVAQSADTEYAIIQCPWDNDDTAVVAIAFTNTPTIIIRAIGAARHAGVWDDGADSPYRLVAADGIRLIQIHESDVTIDGIQLHNTVVDDNTSYCIYSNTAVTGIKISNCICNTSNLGSGINFNEATITVDIWNCAIYNPHEEGNIGILIDSVDIANIYNCTVDRFGEGIDIDAANTSVTVKNCAVFNNATDFADAVGATTNKNASDDAFGTNPVDISPGGVEATEWAKAFTDYANHDYSVKDASSVLYDAGEADVFADDDDIMGTSRPQGSGWDIGGFELIVAGRTAKLTRAFPLGMNHGMPFKTRGNV